jgi:ATP-binding protein involved in chromosome partitioning
MKQIVAVISGKGGVGKSTVAVNLAIALAKTGAKVALVDGDFYGPSVPILLGGGAIHADENGKLVPPEKFGVRYVSIGFFLGDPDTPVIWRGPMLHKALTQLFNDVAWGAVDYCVVDMPPGTGDAPLSLAQVVRLTGAVVVTTPQEVAMADVRKSINMMKQIGVDLFGIIENMAGYLTPDGVTHDIFGSGGGAKMAETFALPLLASIPLDTRIRQGGDDGRPAACESDFPVTQIFDRLALKLIDILGTKHKNAPSLKVVG